MYYSISLQVQEHLNQVILATGEERDVVTARERLLHSRLPEEPLEPRGLVLAGLRIDKNYCVSTQGGDVEVRLVQLTYTNQRA